MKRRYLCQDCKFLDSNFNPSAWKDRNRRKHCVKYGQTNDGICDTCEGFELRSPCDFQFKIKELEFNEIAIEGIFQAESIFGTYCIRKENLKPKLWHVDFPGSRTGYIPSFDDAKYFCQRDFETRIMEGLEKVEGKNEN